MTGPSGPRPCPHEKTTGARRVTREPGETKFVVVEFRRCIKCGATMPEKKELKNGYDTGD